MIPGIYWNSVPVIACVGMSLLLISNLEYALCVKRIAEIISKNTKGMALIMDYGGVGSNKNTIRVCSTVCAKCVLIRYNIGYQKP